MLTESPYFSSLSFEALPATGYNLVAVRLEVSAEGLQMLSAQGWFER